MTPQPLRLVIFDCDGVLVDSEGPSNAVIAAEATRLGWPLTEAEATARFVGLRLSDVPPVVEAQIGRPVPEGWVETLRQGLIAAFDTVEAMPGAVAAVDAVAAAGLPVRVASNSSHEEMRAKFARVGLMHLWGRQHSARDVPRGKPAPDVFLAAAAAEGVDPAACLVVEDSMPGATAAVRAGMAVVALVPHGDATAFEAMGARVIRHLDELAAIVRGRVAA